jgi:hypothetical protein
MAEHSPMEFSVNRLCHTYILDFKADKRNSLMVSKLDESVWRLPLAAATAITDVRVIDSDRWQQPNQKSRLVAGQIESQLWIGDLSRSYLGPSSQTLRIGTPPCHNDDSYRNSNSQWA